MKINELKHNHSLTDLLKIGIFSILMLSPLIAIGTTCAYAIVNKNAYMSYSNFNAENKQYDIVSNYDNLVVGQRYRFVSNNNPLGVSSISGRLVYEDVNILSSTFNASTNTQIENSTYLGMWYGTNYNSNFIRFNENANLQLSNNQITFEFTFVGFSNINQNNTLPYYFGTMITKSYLTDTTNTLDNAFYYATEKMTQSDLFNWTENTAIYTGVQTMCTQLEIETNVIPILIVYWFILTIIYVIIDIVLKTFTTLTHMLSKETH